MNRKVGLKRIFVCSPLRGIGKFNNIEENKKRAEKLCRIACVQGFAPFAPHLFYTRFLDDRFPLQRQAGIAAGIAFLKVCDELWVYTAAGISEGMQTKIKAAKALGIKVVMDPPAWRGLT